MTDVLIGHPVQDGSTTSVREGRAAVTPVPQAARFDQRCAVYTVIGEIKEISQARYGHKIVFKHAPDQHFMLNEDLHKRLMKRIALDIGLWNAVDGAYLIAIASFGVGATGVASNRRDRGHAAYRELNSV